MAKKDGITIRGSKPKKGERMLPGAKWRLVTPGSNPRVFNGTLLDTVNKGALRLAIFSVPK